MPGWICAHRARTRLSAVAKLYVQKPMPANKTTRTAKPNLRKNIFMNKLCARLGTYFYLYRLRRHLRDRSGLRQRHPPTIPSADFSSVFSTNHSAPASLFRSTGEISRGKARLFRCMGTGFTKRIPTADGRLRGTGPARSPRMHHASYPVFVHRPVASGSASFRPHLAVTPLPFP